MLRGGESKNATHEQAILAGKLSSAPHESNRKETSCVYEQRCTLFQAARWELSKAEE